MKRFLEIKNLKIYNRIVVKFGNFLLQPETKK